MLNLYCPRSLKPSFNRDRRFIPLGLWQLNALLGDGVINDRIILLKASILSKPLIFQSNLFHSIIVEGKNVLSKKSCFNLLLEIYYIALLFLYGILILCVEIIEKKLETVILIFCRNSKVFYSNVAVEESPNLILGNVFSRKNLLLPIGMLIPLAFFKSSFKSISEASVFLTTEKSEVSSANDLGFDTKFSDKSLL